MTNEFAALLQILGRSVNGFPSAVLVSRIDWDRLIGLARSQSIYDYLIGILAEGYVPECPKAYWEQKWLEVKKHIFQNTARRYQLAPLLSRFGESGIQVVLLKGFAAADEYPRPDMRISGDIDLWVKAEDENRALRILGETGFQTEKRLRGRHHAECRHAQIGILELHTHFLDEMAQNIWFDEVPEREIFCEEPIRAQYYSVLGRTDNLIFLTLHLAKHFIESGTSLRMMLDLGLFMKNHYTEIDHRRYQLFLKKRKLDQLIKAVYTALVVYCNFPEETLHGYTGTDEEKMQLFLNDLEQGGGFGSSGKMEREEGYHLLNKTKMDANGQSYIGFMLRWKSRQMAALFPSFTHMKNTYPWLSRFPVLLPFAWSHRVLTRGFRFANETRYFRHIFSSRKKHNKTGNNRLQLFKQMGMI